MRKCVIVRAIAREPRQLSQPNRSKVREFRTAGAKSKAANFRPVVTVHEPRSTSFQSGRQTATRLLRVEMGMLGLRCHFHEMKF
jgi:hypothetical protein